MADCSDARPEAERDGGRAGVASRRVATAAKRFLPATRTETRTRRRGADRDPGAQAALAQRRAVRPRSGCGRPASAAPAGRAAAPARRASPASSRAPRRPGASRPARGSRRSRSGRRAWRRGCRRSGPRRGGCRRARTSGWPSCRCPRASSASSQRNAGAAPGPSAAKSRRTTRVGRPVVVGRVVLEHRDPRAGARGGGVEAGRPRRGVVAEPRVRGAVGAADPVERERRARVLGRHVPAQQQRAVADPRRRDQDGWPVVCPGKSRPVAAAGVHSVVGSPSITWS